MSAHFKIAGPDIVHEEFDGDLVILNLQTGQYFGLNKTGAAMWRCLAGGQDAEILSAEHGRAFAQELMMQGLLAPADGTAEPTEPLQVAEAPTLDVYNDLSDLILADPIHDVEEETGWPKRPDAG